MATKVPQRPKRQIERILCDADMVSLGKTTFFRYDDLLRSEVERREDRVIEEVAWLRRSHRFISEHRFQTSYGRTILERGRRSNVARMRRKLEKATAGPKVKGRK